jgi:hypothetical protein
MAVEVSEPQVNLLFDACRVANFVLANHPPAQQWSDPVGWAQFHLVHGFCAMIHGENGDIVALGVARPVENPGDGAVSYRFDRAGDCLFIDLIIVPKTMPDGMALFSAIAEDWFGSLETIAFFRGEETALRVFNFEKFVKRIRKTGKHYVVTQTASRA